MQISATHYLSVTVSFMRKIPHTHTHPDQQLLKECQLPPFCQKREKNNEKSLESVVCRLLFTTKLSTSEQDAE